MLVKGLWELNGYAHSENGSEDLVRHRNRLRVLGQDDCRLHEIPLRVVACVDIR